MTKHGRYFCVTAQPTAVGRCKMHLMVACVTGKPLIHNSNLFKIAVQIKSQQYSRTMADKLRVIILSDKNNLPLFAAV